jgi:hypothetical protein
MAYATVEQLASALGIGVTSENQDALQDCLDAAAVEIDHFFEVDPVPTPPPGMVVRTNVNRGVEWWKAPAAYNGGVGTNETGVLTAPSSGFERHSAALLPFKRAWGIA